MSIFSVTYSISLAYLLSISLLYLCFYTLHISYSFYNLLLFISYHTFHISLRSVELILYYHIIYYHRFSPILSWLYAIPFVIYYFHVLLSCIVFILFFCYTFHILDLSYTFRVIDTLLLVLVYLSSHSNAMLLISCHVLLSSCAYTCHWFYISCLHKP